MKIKLTLLTAFCLLLLACPASDDDTPITTVTLSSTNYVYEGDLYRFFLNSEIDALRAQIDLWQAIGPNEEGYNEAQAEIAIAEDSITMNNELLEAIASSTQIGLPPIPPPPPAPCICFNLYNSLKYLAVDKNTIDLDAVITDENQEALFTTSFSESQEIEGFQDSVRAYNFNELQTNVTGKGFLTVNRVLADESVRSYTVEVYLNNIQ